MILAILMVILLIYLPSDLQRSPTYYYRCITLVSFRGLLFIALGKYSTKKPAMGLYMFIIINNYLKSKILLISWLKSHRHIR